MTLDNWIALATMTLFAAMLVLDIIVNRQTRKMLTEAEELVRKAEAVIAKEPKRG